MVTVALRPLPSRMCLLSKGYSTVCPEIRFKTSTGFSTLIRSNVLVMSVTCKVCSALDTSSINLTLM